MGLRRLIFPGYFICALIKPKSLAAVSSPQVNEACWCLFSLPSVKGDQSVPLPLSVYQLDLVVVAEVQDSGITKHTLLALGGVTRCSLC